MKYQAKIPTVFTNMLVSKLGEISNKTVLVIRDWYTAVFLAKNNKVLFVTDDPEAEEKFRLVVIRNISFGNDDDAILINTTINKKGNNVTDTKAWLNQIKGLNMKFDVAIMNPPYDRNLHLQILEQIIPICNKVINISPVRWLQDPFAPYLKRSDYNKFENSVSKYIKDIQIIPAKEASDLFGDALFTMNLGIYELDANGGYAYQHNDPLVNKIVAQTMKNSWEPFNIKTFIKNGQQIIKPYALNIAPLRTNESDDKIYITCRNYTNQLQVMPPKSDEGPCGGHFEFDTEKERKNFYDCYASKFMLWTYKLWKVSAKTPSAKVPYFDDYTKPWTNKRFCEYFGITGFISDTEAVPGSEWERILKEM